MNAGIIGEKLDITKSLTFSNIFVKNYGSWSFCSDFHIILHVIRIMAECTVVVNPIVNCIICCRFYATLVTSAGALV